MNADPADPLQNSTQKSLLTVALVLGVAAFVSVYW